MPLDRRAFLSVTGRFGLASTLFPGILYTLATQAEAQLKEADAAAKAPVYAKITPEMVEQAAALAGVPIPREDIAMMIAGLNEQRDSYETLRKLDLPNSMPPAFVFDPLPPGAKVDSKREAPIYSKAPAIRTVPSNLEDLAFDTVPQLAEFVRTRKVSSLDLTEMYIRRIKRYNPLLHFVITITEDRAIAQARAADAEIARGHYRGPLHGLPWSAKDLLAVKGYPTTWGAAPYKDQHFDYDATVVKRLDAAGAVLVAKATMGALAMGDVWFGGITRNPWNPQQGSSGSSAGPASTTSAGCVAFSIGTETLGSISSPSTRCGVTGLRPTFGFVPRTGAMALSWTMDKIGPICRAVEDCAIVLQHIYGPDGEDETVRDAAFNWNADFDWKSLRIGYLQKAFQPPQSKPTPEATPQGETPSQKKQREQRNAMHAAYHAMRVYDHKYDVAALDRLHAMGVSMKQIELPQLPFDAMTPVLNAEGAAAFSELTLSGRDKLLTAQGPDDWANIFRVARFYPAVEYIQAMRAREMAVRAAAKIFDEIDVLVTPTGGEQLVMTNLTGNPAVIVPNGLRGADAPVPPAGIPFEYREGGPGTPVSITFLGGLYQDGKLAAFARAYQNKAGFLNLHPKLPQ
jgi:Asp-tRNA(Asn)/Glu-tRNA(Gln) amidotransferase A subunit family amidase